MSDALTEIHKLPRRYYEDQEWALAHYDRWMEAYPDQWIAVISRRVVAAGTDMEEVSTRAREKTGELHIPLLFIEKQFRFLRVLGI